MIGIYTTNKTMQYFINTSNHSAEETIQDLIDADWQLVIDENTNEIFFNEPVEDYEMQPFGIICV
jgi:hypothetical protein